MRAGVDDAAPHRPRRPGRRSTWRSTSARCSRRRCVITGRTSGATAAAFTDYVMATLADPTLPARHAALLRLIRAWRNHGLDPPCRRLRGPPPSRHGGRAGGHLQPRRPAVPGPRGQPPAVLPQGAARGAAAHVRRLRRDHRRTSINLARWDAAHPAEAEIPFKPARVVLQDFTGVPAVVDLAAMRSAIAALGGDPRRINPLHPGRPGHRPLGAGRRLRRARRARREHAAGVRAQPRALRAPQVGPAGVRDLPVVPPGTGIVHQVNLEYLARGVFSAPDGDGSVAFPDTLVGTDSHTTMINGLGVVGWGVGGIEAEAVMLGQPLSMLLPEVVGFRLTGRLPRGRHRHRPRPHGHPDPAQAGRGRQVRRVLRPRPVGDLAARPGHHRQHGPRVRRHHGLLPGRRGDAALPARAPAAPRDARRPGRALRQGAGALPHRRRRPTPTSPTSSSSTSAAVEPSPGRAQAPPGPRRPRRRQGRLPGGARRPRRSSAASACRPSRSRPRPRVETPRRRAPSSRHGAVVIAAITSCTNTSNPSVMLAAGLLAKKAVERGLTVPPLRQDQPRARLARGHRLPRRAPGCTPYLEQLGFHVVGYGCTTCIGNSGPLPEPVAAAITEQRPGGRRGALRQPQLRGPHQPATSGPTTWPRRRWSSPTPWPARVDIDLTTEPLGTRPEGPAGLPARPLADQPTSSRAVLDQAGDPETFRRLYADLNAFNPEWNAIPVAEGPAVRLGGRLHLHPGAAVLRRPAGRAPAPIGPIAGARVLALLGDSVTTDHISPAGSIATDSARPAAT